MDGLEDVDKAWLLKTVNLEVERLRRSGTKPILLSTKNFVMTVEEGTPSRIVNKIELDTGFDFDKITQILVSDPIPYPGDTSWEYANVLLITTNAQFPMILPYLYRPSMITDVSDSSSSEPTTAEVSKKKKRGKADRPTILRNSLTDWIFVNNSGKQSRHVVHEFVSQ
ncbi:hypothetical protein SmJEL517_g02216 [Synchytrium microbalum]|uniref:Uncharacterized protein n=1 Tax=Synchytrium microbalum TaxID=1806994 RepID=A0A507C6Z3_9FUNG|nr:uncharacterized protein SmJEL517_g02216 [Synchytrium microbalum]TPX35271.1 hypothetical protein SmJEL517_g02216 [Synchytrium microbalum]